MTARGKQERRNAVLWAEEWAALERLAVEFDTCPPSGPTAGQPSWRSLLKEIARGAITLTRERPLFPVEKLYATLTCPFCGEETTSVGGGANHFRMHVRRGEAEEVLVAQDKEMWERFISLHDVRGPVAAEVVEMAGGSWERRFRKRGETYSPEVEARTVVVIP